MPEMKIDNNLEQLKQYNEAKDRNTLTTDQIKAYFYYKYFITQILPSFIKKYLSNSNFKKFDMSIHVYDMGIRYYDLLNQKKEFLVRDLKNRETIHIHGMMIHMEFVEYMKNFYRRLIDLSNKFGKKISAAYDNDMFSFDSILYVFRFDCFDIDVIISAYYSELQRLEYINELIASIQEEENTKVNEKKLKIYKSF